MQYVISFLEGIITFISPCLLPMLPIYISYFAGGGERSIGKTLAGAVGFVAGFTAVFVTMGALAGTVGGFLREYQTAVNIISGLVVIFFGLNFLGVFQLNLFKGSSRSVDTGKYEFLFSIALWRDLFPGLDALRRSLPGLCADAGLSAGACGGRDVDAPCLFFGAGNSFPSQRRADRLSEVGFQLDQRSLPGH